MKRSLTNLSCWWLPATLVLLSGWSVGTAAEAAACRPGDELYMISSRHLSVGDAYRTPRRPLRAWRGSETGTWQRIDIERIIDQPPVAHPATRRTVIYVHGNRMPFDAARRRGLFLYRHLVTCEPSRPLRLIVWSWPSEQIKGPLQDVRTKAARTNLEATYLSWFLRELECSSSDAVSLIGYSFGARVVTGSLHMMAGGSVAGRTLSQDPCDNSGYQVVLMAAALHNDWLLPGRCHDQAMDRVASMLLLYNSCDRVLKRYHHVERRGHPVALGYAGLPGRHRLGPAAARFSQRDVRAALGTSHDERTYYQTSWIRSAIFQGLGCGKP